MPAYLGTWVDCAESRDRRCMFFLATSLTGSMTAITIGQDEGNLKH